MSISVKLLAFLVLTLLTGCVSTVYHGESFSPTRTLTLLKNDSEKAVYQLIGTGYASGEYSGTTNAELRQKLYDLGLVHGAEAMKITGTRLIPDGHVVNMAQYNFIEATDDPDQTFTETDFQETISGDPNRGYTRYLRVMYAEYYRKKIKNKL